MKVASAVLCLAFAGGLAFVLLVRSCDGESWRVEETKHYAVSEISPLLEVYRKKHAKYPAALQDLSGFQLSDRAKKMSFVYGATWPDGHYEFSFSPDDFAGFTGGRWDYHSAAKSWSFDR